MDLFNSGNNLWLIVILLLLCSDDKKHHKHHKSFGCEEIAEIDSNKD